MGFAFAEHPVTRVTRIMSLAIVVILHGVP
jgi:hypothetical protein